jgi:hypothetical protein
MIVGDINLSSAQKAALKMDFKMRSEISPLSTWRVTSGGVQRAGRCAIIILIVE